MVGGVYIRCPNCRGSGKDFYNHVCHICNGKGSIFHKMEEKNEAN